MENKERLQHLEWLLEEIDSRFREATEALEKYLQDTTDDAQLRLAAKRLHQVCGSLEIADFPLPLQLASEANRAIDSLLGGKQANSAEICQYLVNSFLQLSSYLRQLVEAGDKNTSIIIVSLNDLRAIQRQPLVDLGGFLAPDLSGMIASSRPTNKFSAEEFSALIEKLRQMYQYSLLRMINGENFRQNLGYLLKAFTRFAQIAEGSPKEPVWRVSKAVLEGLEDGSIRFGSAVERLLKSLDDEILPFVESGVGALEEESPLNLVQDLMFYILVSGSENPAAIELVKHCEVNEELAAQISASQSHVVFADAQASKALSDSFNAELDQIKDSLERYVLEGEDDQLLVKALAGVKKLSSSLSLVGIESQQQAAEKLAEKIELVVSKKYKGEIQSLLVDMAGEIVGIEAGIYRQLNQSLHEASDGEYADSVVVLDTASIAVLKEVKQNLEKVKDSIVNFVSSKWQQGHLDGVVDILAGASAAFNMLNQSKVASLVEACKEFVAKDLLRSSISRSPERSKMDALAETIASIDYYIECLDKHEPDRAEEVLAAVAEKVSVLNVSIKDADVLAKVDGLLKQDATANTAQNVVKAEPAVEPEMDENAAEVDDEILEIFVEEVGEVTEVLNQQYPSWVADPDNEEALGDIRRAFHTLKGSGRMVGADVIGDMAWSIESLLNKLIEKRIELSSSVHGLVDLAIGQVTPLTKSFESRTKVSNLEFIQEIISAADKVASGEVVELPSEVSTVVEEVVEAEPVAEENTLLSIFSVEAGNHLQAIEDFVNSQKKEAPLYTFPPGSVQRALHTLKGSALMAELFALADVVTPLEHFVKELFHHQIDVDSDIVDLLSDAVSTIQLAVSQIENNQAISLDGTPQFLARLEELKARSLGNMYAGDKKSAKAQATPEFLNTLMQEGMQQVLAADEILDTWLKTGDSGFVAGMLDELNSVAKAASQAAITPLAEIAQYLNKAYTNVYDLMLPLDQQLIDGFKAGHSQLMDMVDTIAASLDVQPLDEKVAHTLETIANHQAEEPVEPVVKEVKKPKAEKLEFTQRPVAKVVDFDIADVDIDILETFLVEADELSEAFDGALNAWQENPENTDRVEEIKRILHTMKGGARMAGLVQVGDMSHELESDIISLEPQLNVIDQSVFDYLFLQQDSLGKALVKAQELMSAAASAAPVVEEVIDEIEEDLLELESEVEAEPVEVDVNVPHRRATDAPLIERNQAAVQEMIRIAAPALENLVNLAGETSISRGRIEQLISEFHASLDDMDTTIRRLQGQVRLLGIETEAQVMFRREQIEASETVEGFDPLEMDRYSQLQQLSKSLLESSSDLLDLKSTLLNAARDTETQLLQQSRIQSDLQEGLMRARMVSFSHIVPRLRRIVRQVGADLGKNVRLTFTNTDGEMDRSVLEKMVAPLEHMLRNAIDHGIESVEDRKKSGKPEQGTITIGMLRRGGEVLIQVSDDGKGLDIAAIKAKAINQKLMAAKAELSDQEIAEFIFQAGFSTSKNVTQVSGRGVGMDVVFSQVRQLGGAVELDNNPGRGLNFQVRLPFTVSVNRALMVRMRDDLYALPLNSIDGVVNISISELEKYYKHPDSKLEYGGELYSVRYLGALLADDLMPKIDPIQNNASLVLVHSDTGLYAVHVDSLLTSQEVVVKSLGEQFSAVAGLSGATILNDGRVVVILDLLELLRNYTAHATAPVALQTEVEKDSQDSSVQTIMVVDDSVTVRKVTGRFLEREGFNVLTAKDGMEAIQLLQDHQPDLMLLDIEMPRMDGFEVAQRVKTTQRWRDIPIIMVTSRTGEKHRNRAMELGVDGYVGKPFQEQHLLENITELIGISIG